jgi:anti-sigma factor RsiW
MNCDWVKSNVTLYVYDELPDDARYEFEQHVHRCAGCAAELERQLGFKSTMSAIPVDEPSPNLLASCRMRLQEGLETANHIHGWRRILLDPMSWLRQARMSPALATVLLMLGFAAGVGTTYQIAHQVPQTNVADNPALQQPAEASIAGIRDITQQPGSNKVNIHYDTLKPQTVQGSLDDPRIQQLLLFAARNNQNSGLRMDSVDLLTQTKTEDEAVRDALVYALRYDNNPGVRLKALEALGPAVKSDMRVRNAVLEALANDSNPGVRNLAIQMVTPVKADSAVRQVLQHLANNDQNQYIRTESRMLLASTPPID